MMGIFVKCSDFHYFAKFVTIYYCLITCTEASTVEVEESLADFYESTGIIKWKWDPKLFCKSQTQRYSLHFKEAYIKENDIVLELAGCTKIRMEILNCRYVLEDVGFYIQRTLSYVNGLNDDIYHVGTPSSESRCNAPLTRTITKTVFDGLHKLTPLAQAVSSSVSDIVIERKLAEYYKVIGPIKWKWDSKSFCELQTPTKDTPVHFLRSHVRVEDSTLKWADCTQIRMEILQCDYNYERLDMDRYVRRKYFVCGPNDEIFKLSKANTLISQDTAKWIFHGAPISVPATISCILPLHVQLADAEYILAKYYEINGNIKWKWDPNLFCKSAGVIPKGMSAESLQIAFVENQEIMLEGVNCTKIDGEVLSCEYANKNDVGDFVWRRELYINGPNKEIFHADQPDEESKCDDPYSLTIDGVVSEGVRKPRSDTGISSSVDNDGRSLAE